MGVALFRDEIQQWSDLEQGVIVWVCLWQSFSVVFDVEVLVYLLIPAHDVTSSRHPQQGIQQPVHVDFREVMNAKHVLDEHKDFNISSGVVSVQYLSFFSAASCFWVAYLFVCSESVSKNKSGTNRSKKSMGVAVGGSVWFTVGLGVNLCSMVTSLV